MAATGRAKGSKRPDTRPAKARYWSSGKLRKRKIRNLMKHNGLSEAEAIKLWTSTRKGRMKTH